MRTVAVDAPGAYELSSHELHETHRLRLTTAGEVSVYAIAFAAGMPPVER